MDQALAGEGLGKLGARSLAPCNIIQATLGDLGLGVLEDHGGGDHRVVTDPHITDLAGRRAAEEMGLGVGLPQLGAPAAPLQHLPAAEKKDQPSFTAQLGRSLPG